MISIGAVSFAILVGALSFLVLVFIGLIFWHVLRRQRELVITEEMVRHSLINDSRRKKEFNQMLIDVAHLPKPEAEKFCNDLAEAEKKLLGALISIYNEKKLGELGSVQKFVDGLLGPCLQVIAKATVISQPESSTASLDNADPFAGSVLASETTTDADTDQAQQALAQAKQYSEDLEQELNRALKVLNLLFSEYAAMFSIDVGGQTSFSLDEIETLIGNDPHAPAAPAKPAEASDEETESVVAEIPNEIPEDTMDVTATKDKSSEEQLLDELEDLGEFDGLEDSIADLEDNLDNLLEQEIGPENVELEEAELEEAGSEEAKLEEAGSEEAKLEEVELPVVETVDEPEVSPVTEESESAEEAALSGAEAPPDAIDPPESSKETATSPPVEPESAAATFEGLDPDALSALSAFDEVKKTGD